MLPLVSIDMPNIVHVVLYGWEIESFSLVTIDASDKQVLRSSVTYIKSSKEGLCTDDADQQVIAIFATHFYLRTIFGANAVYSLSAGLSF
jgi:hypothetical protein